MSLPVISVEQMREWEETSWDAGRSEADVIETAGQAIAQTALRMTREDDRILILAGKGHNGDDARHAQPHLIDRRVKLLNVTNPAGTLDEVGTLLDRGPSLVIDGLFGIGLNRPLESDWAEFIERVNRSGIPILSIDVPSGLNAQTGEPQNIAITATTTVTLGAPKTGLVLPSSYPFVGRLEIAPEIGLLPLKQASDLQWTTPDDFQNFPPARRVDGHKGTFGHVVILAGSEGYHGAAVLSSRGALRARPGLVSVFCDRYVYLAVASQSQAAMVHSFSAGALPESCTAMVLGPGLAHPHLEDYWKDYVNDHWQSFPMPVIVDASALDWIKPGPTPLNSRRVLTPHPGEAARLLGTKVSAIQENRVAALREISSKYGNCWVVLKGHHTLIGRNSGEIFINSSGDSHLAQGGSGDVLAGFLGGLLAQPKLQAQPLKTIRYAVWAHGFAAEALSATGRAWTVEDLLGRIGDRIAINPG